MAGFSPIQRCRWFLTPRRNTLHLSWQRYLPELLYDDWCDLPPASPMTGASRLTCGVCDWYNSACIIAAGALTCRRRADAHFFTEVRYKAQTSYTDYSGQPSLLRDQWLAPKAGTDNALAIVWGHVILKSFISIIPATIFLNIAAVIPTCQCWSCWMSAQTVNYVPGAYDARVGSRCGWTDQ